MPRADPAPRRLRVKARRWARRPGHEVPLLALEGAWLRDDAGIWPGDEVDVTARDGVVTVRRIDDATTRRNGGAAG